MKVPALCVLGASVALALAGCTSSPQTQPSGPPPVDFLSAVSKGTTVIVALPVKGSVDIIYTGPADMESKYWTADIADPAVAAFSPADAGPTNIPPMFTGLKDGETTAVLTYSGGASPESVTFDITVGTS